MRNETCMKNVAVIIPIYKPNKKFNDLLTMLKKQKNVSFDLVVIDSASNFDDYKEDLKGLDYKIIKISPKEFNHGGTRQMGADECRNYSYLVYMTQDAIPVDEFSIFNLLKSFDNPVVACAYGRQLPHKDATILAARARMFNYPSDSIIKTKDDIKKLGVKVSFISDTFAAYRHDVLNEVGGFPKNVILGEDMYVASKMILTGWANAYCADAEVYHSHNYSVVEEFKRYFDTGVFHARETWIQNSFGRAENEGIKFVFSELKYLLKNYPNLIPSMIIRDAFKLVGYRLGKKEQLIPLGIKRKLSMSKSYWSL